MHDKQYQPGDRAAWTGRVDGADANFRRWHQRIEMLNLDTQKIEFDTSFVLLGFCCDEGVRRNLGRVGAKDGPATVRKVLANLPDHIPSSQVLMDAGDVVCIGEDMESAQQELAKRVGQVLEQGGFTIVIGGGHEITYGHYQGVKQAKAGKKIGIINLDAHFDARQTQGGRGNSGTGFYQILEEAKAEGIEVGYLALGIQEISNTLGLFRYADQNGVRYILRNELTPWNLEKILEQIEDFANGVDAIYVTVDMDFFAAPYAPGVSSPAFNGVVPDSMYYALFNFITTLPKVCTIDFAEINPQYDIDSRTTKLAAEMIFRLVNNG
ncbi:formimidoylglutamase [Sphingobacterium lactis]|uniref:Formimidoylglutamase n=1 Tax=Sphingobacterium lactis TaxID=797291 RepID=A0A1H6B1U9_9SPHI|nr:formimidoylglutamase [Sphingobacterium lactis]SEG54779.1 formiminoglutamase [Sphingobacterium lactis]